MQQRPIQSDEPIAPRPSVHQRFNLAWLLWLLVPAAALWLNWPRVAALIQPPPPVVELPIPEPSRPMPQTTSTARPPSPPVQTQTPAVPKSLQECMGDSNVVNDKVMRCRYGDVPRAVTATEPAQGMVSAQYLAEYKANQTTRPTRRAVSSGTEQHWISSWDGRARYWATWEISDNRIDHGSVCGNQKRGSIEYRECRKGAKQWFKDRCRELRGAGEGLAQRYCSAASGFSPM